jgi:GNAT superfamily N-acetyltransferase
VRVVHASGLEALRLTTDLLHRVRLADPDAGIWEAADVQWWWRMPRRSDALEQRFLVDDDGPVAAATLTEWPHAWGLDPIVVPGATAGLERDVILEALERLQSLARETGFGPRRVETLVRDGDRETIAVLGDAGFEPTDDRGGTTWLPAADRPAVSKLQAGLSIVDRTGADRGPHPMIKRSGPAVEERLRQASLYDPWLDLAVRTDQGEVAGYALFWFDGVTRVGLVEPMRVEDAWQRRGLGRALLTEGLSRLVERGATRLKVGWGSPPGRGLYLGAGFIETSTETTYARALETR